MEERVKSILFHYPINTKQDESTTPTRWNNPFTHRKE